AARGLASLMRGASPAFAPVAKALESTAYRTAKIAEIQRLFEPFSSKLNGPFDCSNPRAAFARATDADKARLRWAPESIDWLDWMMNIHMPAIEKRVIPEMERRLKKEPRPAPALAALGWRSTLAESEASVVVWDEAVPGRDAISAAHPELVPLDLRAAVLADDSLAPPDVAIAPGDVASLLFTSGTTSRPKGVMLTHANFTSLVAGLAPIFPLSRGDAVLSVLPLHHTFEFTCGLLLPLSRGARVVYVGERTGEGISEGLRAARASAMVGVPALWQLLERRVLQQVDASGPMARAAFDAATAANAWLSTNLGVAAGRVLFGAVHGHLGGQMKWLISGGAALPRETQELFFGLGLRLTQGYGLTEAAPVL